MAPKRSLGKVVVKATKKVVEKTVDISVDVDDTGEARNPDKTVTKDINDVVEETSRKKPQHETAKKVTPLKIEGKKGRKHKMEKKTEKSHEGNEKTEGKKKLKKTQVRGKEEKKKDAYCSSRLVVSSRAVVIINGMMNDMFERLAKEAAK
ncbi:hypothetical protein MKX01_002503 [Papaver californicum]|nr:hypothetical protein MKX01_002503 [Papaver californicum]